MKVTKLIAIVSLLLAAGGFRALADPSLTINITASFLIQNTNSFTNARSHAVTTGAPLRRVFTTAEFLRRMAIDENIAGNYLTNRFPRGARLVSTNNSFAVMVGTNVLVDVGNIVSFASGNTDIVSGTTDTNGLSRPKIDTHLASVTFDDTGINTTNGARFTITGVMTETTSDSGVDRHGNFSEVHVATMANALGEGTFTISPGDVRPAIVIGAVTASGSSIQPFVP